MIKTVGNVNGEAVGSVVHVFERAGLGKAPFRFVGMERKTYQACHGAPVQPGGMCDFCGEALVYCFQVRSSDGKLFTVGCNCVAKTEDGGLRKVVDAKMREAKRNANNARMDARIAAARALLPSVEATFKALPHPQDWRAAQGETKLDQIKWYLANAGRQGQTWAAKEIEEAAKLLAA